MNIKLSKKNLNITPSVTLTIDAKIKQMKSEGIDVISFGVGEPDFHTPDNIKKAAVKVIEKGSTGYTAASGLPQLKEVICQKLEKENKLHYKPENIIVSNGAKHSLFNIFQAICNPDDEVVIPTPYWVSYPELVKMADATPVYIECSEDNGFKLKKEDLISVITRNTKAIILNSPSNPTGSLYTKEELEEIAEIAVKHDILVVADEIYEKLVYDGEEHISIASLNEEIKERTIVINGMSKGYAMTGWRIGYTASNTEIAKIMGNIQSHATSNPNTIAQYASIEGLTGDQTSIEEMRRAFDERRKYMVNRINQIKDISCITPKGAFYVMMNISKWIGREIKGNKIKNSIDFAEVLLENANVAIVPGLAFGADDFIRLSYATSLENIEEGLNRIDNFLNS
ncbi:pyridoxal phosphate-dependent aminotransferase [Natronincola ferrireducens]|uniref:Aminotransferase n=1 Tax=Natronincola ferrireducens TaxID=393762 RepID=A0A1G9C8G1_9FIRM|nr:pyridoxal phosphate-dependent aminotransferase [Natronincola ferrireducens]SDK47941.1 L-aspartate aminotransferase apoenzyme [Natronincola ferrireducens]